MNQSLFGISIVYFLLVISRGFFYCTNFTSTATYKLKEMASVDTTAPLPKNCYRYTLTNYQLNYLIFEPIVTF